MGRTARLGFFSLAACLGAVPWLAASAVEPGPQAPTQASAENLDQLVEEAFRNNPQLKSGRSQVAAAQARIPQASAWEPPQVGVDFFQTPIRSFPNPIRDYQEIDYFAQQTFRFPGKLAASEKAAQAMAQQTESFLHALEREVVRSVKAAYFGLFLTQRSLAINTENKALMQKFVDIASREYEVGISSQQDVLKAQTELSVLANEALILQQKKLLAEATLNTLLSRPTDGSFGEVAEPCLEGPAYTFEQLEPLVTEARPELQALRFAIQSSEAEASRARRDYFPDLMLRLAYKQMSPAIPDNWELMLLLDVPMAPWSGGRFRGRVEEIEAGIARGRSDLLAQRNLAMLETQGALVRARTARDLGLLYRTTVLPQAHQTLQSAIAAYQTGKVDFLSLLDAYRTVLERRLDYYRAVVDYESALSDLERAVGLGQQEISARLR